MASSEWAIIQAECPGLVEYSLEEQRKLAGELQRLPRDATTHKFIADYGKLRKGCRYIEEQRDKKRRGWLGLQ